MVKKLALSACALMLPLLSSAAADARPYGADVHPRDSIVCRGSYQSVEGRPVATPYCEAAALARVAREHGSNVAASSIRSDPGIKDEVCRFVNSDVNAQQYCDNESD